MHTSQLSLNKCWQLFNYCYHFHLMEYYTRILSDHVEYRSICLDGDRIEEDFGSSTIFLCDVYIF
jgi:hypothetical protein